MTKTELNSKTVIIRAEQEIIEAMRHADVSKLDALIHEELLFHVPNGQTITKAMDLENYRSGQMQVNDIAIKSQEIKLVNDIATVSCIINMQGKFIDQSIEGQYRILRVWKLFDNQWKVIAGSSIQL